MGVCLFVMHALLLSIDFWLTCLVMILLLVVVIVLLSCVLVAYCLRLRQVLSLCLFTVQCIRLIDFTLLWVYSTFAGWFFCGLLCLISIDFWLC